MSMNTQWRFTKKTGQALMDWQEDPTCCPACGEGELESLPDDGRGGQEMATEYECLECNRILTHVHNVSVSWPSLLAETQAAADSVAWVTDPSGRKWTCEGFAITLEDRGPATSRCPFIVTAPQSEEGKGTGFSDLTEAQAFVVSCIEDNVGT